MFAMIPAIAWLNGCDSLARPSAALSLHCDGAAGSVSTLTDSSGGARNASCTGVSLVAGSKFGSAAASFSGSGSYADVADAAALEFGSGDFCIELWLYAAAVPGAGAFTGIVSKRATSTTQVAWVVSMWGTGGITVELSTSGTAATTTLQSGVLPAIGAYTHVAVNRRGPLIALAINGIVKAATNFGTSAIANTTSVIGLARLSTTLTTNLLNGRIDELCISVGSSPNSWHFPVPNKAVTP